MLDEYVSIEWHGAPCANRCRHCYLNAGERRVTSVSYKRAKGIAQRFCDWAKRFDEPGQHVNLTVGESLEHSPAILVDSMLFRRDHGMQGWDFLNVNGLRYRTRSELVSLYGSLKEAGARLVNLSWHGYADAHDDYAGRKGEFDYLLLMAEVIAELGLQRSDTVLLRKPILTDLAKLMDVLGSIASRGQLVPNMIDYLGRGESVEEERLEMHDLDSLPDELVSRINLSLYRTEASWIETILRDDLAPKTSITYFIAIDEDNIGYLEDEACDDILHGIRKNDEARRAGEPSLADLARTYGDPVGQKLYRLRDLERKWPELFWKDHDSATYERFVNLRDLWARIT